MEDGSRCWVCGAPILRGERVTHVASLGFEVHSRCADVMLRDEPAHDETSPDPSQN